MFVPRKRESPQLLRTRTVLTVRLSKWRTTTTTTAWRPCSWCVPPHVPTLSTHRSRAGASLLRAGESSNSFPLDSKPPLVLPHPDQPLLPSVSAVGLRRGRPARPARRARLPQQVRPRLARADPDDRHPPTRRDGRIAHESIPIDQGHPRGLAQQRRPHILRLAVHLGMELARHTRPRRRRRVDTVPKGRHRTRRGVEKSSRA